MQKEIFIQHLDLQRIAGPLLPRVTHFTQHQAAAASYFDAVTSRIEFIIFESKGSIKQDLAMLCENLGQHYFLFHDVIDIVRSSVHNIIRVS